MNQNTGTAGNETTRDIQSNNNANAPTGSPNQKASNFSQGEFKMADNNSYTNNDSAWDKTKQAGSNAWEATKDGASKAWDKTKEVSSDTWEAAKNAAENTADAVTETDDEEIEIDINENDGTYDPQYNRDAARNENRIGN